MLGVVENEKKRKIRVTEVELCIGVCMELVGSSSSASDPVVTYQFWPL